jgi:hypothetical protein
MYQTTTTTFTLGHFTIQVFRKFANVVFITGSEQGSFMSGIYCRM